MEAVTAFSFVSVFALALAFTYERAEQRNRDAWTHDVDYAVSTFEPEDRYRASSAPPYVYRGPVAQPRAPRHVRAIAAWTIGMGQMLVPGAALAFAGTLVLGVGLVGIPGCILAGRLWALGPALLRADPRAVQWARAAANFAFVLNAVVVCVVVSVVASMADGELLLARMTDGELLLALPVVGYAAISVAHGFALKKAAATLEALWVGRGYSREQIRRMSVVGVPARMPAHHAPAREPCVLEHIS